MRTLLALLLLLMCTTLAAQSPSAAPPIEVESAPLSALLQGLSRSAPAQVRARHEAALSAEVNGQIRVVHVDTGDAIRAGAVLVTLDDRDARLALAQAEAQREAAVARL